MPYVAQPNLTAAEGLTQVQEYVEEKPGEEAHFTVDALYSTEDVFLREGTTVTGSVKNSVFASIWKVLESNLPLGYSKMAYHIEYDIIAAVYCEYSKDFTPTTLDEQGQAENINGEQKIVVHRTISSAFEPHIIPVWEHEDSSDVRKYLAQVQEVRESNEQYKTMTKVFK
jgi:hypothetical protein